MRKLRPTLSDLFEREEVILVKKGYRRKYRLNLKTVARNFINMVSFWKKKKHKIYISAIEENLDPNTIAAIKEELCGIVKEIQEKEKNGNKC